MKNKFFCILFLLPFIFPVSAQNPGYRGKRLSLYYDLYCMNSLNFPNENGQSGLTSFNTKHTINMDVAVGRRLCIGGAFEYLRTSFPYDNPSITYNKPYYTYYGELSYNSTTFQTHDKGGLESLGFGIYLKHFSNGNIAPLGAYFKPQATLLLYSLFPGDPVDISGEHASNVGLDLHPVNKYHAFILSVEIGQNRILFNRMFIDYGVRLGFMPQELKNMENGNSVMEAYKYLETVPLTRLASHYLLDVKAGIGVLLF